MSDCRPVTDTLECKGCGRCLEACPRDALRMSEEFNARGFRFAVYRGDGCIGCGLCFYACPEPNALRVEPAAEPRSVHEQPATGEQ